MIPVNILIVTPTVSLRMGHRAETAPGTPGAVRKLTVGVTINMFTGIIEELDGVRSIEQNGENARIVIEARTVTEDTKHGDSISVNGVCLTGARHSTRTRLLPTSREETLGSLNARPTQSWGAGKSS